MLQQSRDSSVALVTALGLSPANRGCNMFRFQSPENYFSSQVAAFGLHWHFTATTAAQQVCAETSTRKGPCDRLQQANLQQRKKKKEKTPQYYYSLSFFCNCDWLHQTLCVLAAFWNHYPSRNWWAVGVDDVLRSGEHSFCFSGKFIKSGKHFFYW